MILDDRLEVADAVSIAASAGTANVGDVIDLGVARDIGQAEPLYLVINVATEVITGGAAGTLKFQLVSDSSGTIATDGTQTIHFVSEEFITDGTDANDARLKAGQFPVVVQLPMEGPPYERYLAVQAVTATTTTTAGAVNAFLTSTPSRWKAYDAPAQA